SAWPSSIRCSPSSRVSPGGRDDLPGARHRLLPVPHRGRPHRVPASRGYGADRADRVPGAGAMSGDREWRVSWQREGRRRKFVTFKTRASAERRATRVAGETEDDLHWMCDEGHGYTNLGP